MRLQLWLNNNLLTDAGAVDLASAIKDAAEKAKAEDKEPALTKIWSSTNHKLVSCTQRRSLRLGFTPSSAVELRRINGNKIGDSGLTALATALPESNIKEFWFV